MNFTSPSYPTRGRCCALIRRVRWSADTAIVSLAIAIAGALLDCDPSLASENESEYAIGITDLFLESGHPNPFRAPGPFTTAVSLNEVVGATRFYDAGFTGTGAVIANIEAGHIWNGHETLSHVGLIPTSGSASGQFDRHATAVASVMGGRPGGANPGHYQQGIAPDAQFYSGAIATNWTGTRFSGNFNFITSGISTYGPYRAAIMTGVTGPGGRRTADVVNSSWVGNLGFFGVTGNDQLAGTIDAMVATNPRALFVAAAGNSGVGPNQIASPANGYNNLSVAALAPNGGAYDLPSSFSSGGPNDYQDPNRFVSLARQVVDIAGPGENFSVAYYGGQTGGNGPTLSGPPNGPAGGPDWYSHSVDGTSFAAPTIAGGAALLYDAAYSLLGATPDARDARVMKAVLMNSADKTLGWDNGQVAHPNGDGGVLTTQGLDNRVGAGRLNLDRAFDQLLSGTTDVLGTAQGALGAVDENGWDFGRVAQGTTNDYLIDGTLVAGSPFTATLTWFRDRQTVGTTTFSDISYDNLDLELWDVIGNTAAGLISASSSRYNNAEHFTFSVPTTGHYMLRVRWLEELFDVAADVNNELYGLAWSTVAVPEPGTFVLMVVGISALLFARRPR